MRSKGCRDVFLRKPMLWQLWALGILVGIFGTQGYYFYSRLVETGGDKDMSMLFWTTGIISTVGTARSPRMSLPHVRSPRPFHFRSP